MTEEYRYKGRMVDELDLDECREALKRVMDVAERERKWHVSSNALSDDLDDSLSRVRARVGRGPFPASLQRLVDATEKAGLG